jgi:hypothetical protein
MKPPLVMGLGRLLALSPTRFAAVNLHQHDNQLKLEESNPQQQAIAGTFPKYVAQLIEETKEQSHGAES